MPSDETKRELQEAKERLSDEVCVLRCSAWGFGCRWLLRRNADSIKDSRSPTDSGGAY